MSSVISHQFGDSPDLSPIEHVWNVIDTCLTEPLDTFFPFWDLSNLAVSSKYLQKEIDCNGINGNVCIIGPEPAFWVTKIRTESDPATGQKE